jgi:AAA ATPase domain
MWPFASKNRSEFAQAKTDEPVGQAASTGVSLEKANGASNAPLRPTLGSIRVPVAEVHPIAIDAKASRGTQLPHFDISASDQPLSHETSDVDTTGTRGKLLNAFTSTQPVTNRDYLFGRYEELQKLIVSVSEQRAHALVYGPRGYGKTSLVRVFGEIADEARYVVLYLSCGEIDSFSGLLRPYLDLVPPEYCSKAVEMSSGANGVRRTTLSDLLPADFTARQLANILATIEGTRLIFIFDEYDRITDASVQREMANLIKDLSDLQARVHLVLVGVAGNVQDLLGFHPSIHRSLVCIPVRRLESADARKVIEHGASECGLQFEPDVIETIESIAHGSAYHLRLMCMDAGLAALKRNRTRVDDQAMCAGMRNVLAEWCALDRVGAQITAAIRQDDFALAAIAAIARTSLKNGKSFTVSQAVPILLNLLSIEKTAQVPRKLGRLCKELAANDGLLVAEPHDGGGPITYSFKNHLAAPFVLIACYLEVVDQPQRASGLAESQR